jgi:hypothetical protein
LISGQVNPWFYYKLKGKREYSHLHSVSKEILNYGYMYHLLFGSGLLKENCMGIDGIDVLMETTWQPWRLNYVDLTRM